MEKNKPYRRIDRSPVAKPYLLPFELDRNLYPLKLTLRRADRQTTRRWFVGRAERSAMKPTIRAPLGSGLPAMGERTLPMVLDVRTMRFKGCDLIRMHS